MTCANWGIIVFALIVLVLAIWPSVLGTVLVKWVLIVSALLIILIVWTGCKCFYCEVPKKRK